MALARIDGDNVSLAGSGAAVLDLLDEPRTLDELANALAEAYDADVATSAADVEPLLDQLTESGFVATDA